MENPNATNTLDVNQSRNMKSAEDAIAMLTGINKMLAGDAYCNSVYREVMNVVMDPAQVPFVQHCTSGKDRVGAGSATILMALGVPRETIMEDYLLSNENQISASKLGSGTSSAGMEITPEMLKMFAALTKVHKEYLEAFFATIDAKLGGTEGYLKQGLGLTDTDLARVKELYLEEM
jgi:protein-tyrosine phosphatase